MNKCIILYYHVNMLCPNCDLEFGSFTSVSLHFRNKHGTSKDLKEILRKRLVDERHGGVEPTCKCGCGKVPKYRGHVIGYNEYILGHVARVNNNWGHNKPVLEKSQETRRGMYKRGEMRLWAKGLTKETDERLAAYGRKGSNTIRSKPGELEKRSERMRKNRLDGTVPTLYGKEHSQWKGGVSAFQQLVRSHLHRHWVFPKMKLANFKCCQCQSNQFLCVHHDQERFASILHKAVKELGEPGDDFDKKSKIADWVVDYHMKNDVSGIVLCEECHNKIHEAEREASKTEAT